MYKSDEVPNLQFVCSSDLPLNSFNVLSYILLELQTAYNLIRNEVCSAVFPLIMKNATGGNKLILQLWHVNPAVVLWEFIDVLNADPESIIRVLDTCQELKVGSPYCCCDIIYSFVQVNHLV